MSYALIKTIHVSCAVGSLGLFVLRGVWMLTTPVYLARRWVRILPHSIDTVLLLSAVTLAVLSQQYPGVDAWLTAKIVALLIYIGLGLVALRFGRDKGVRIIAWVCALLVFMYIVAVALSKSVWPF